jgi:hypothetical protein
MQMKFIFYYLKVLDGFYSLYLARIGDKKDEGSLYKRT